MRLKFNNITDAGDIEKERVVFRAMANIDIGRYALLRTHPSEDGGATTDIIDVFWFPDQDVKSGDLVVLYSKVGEPRQKEIAKGSKAYFYYWGKSEAVWIDKEKVGVLLSISAWRIFHPQKTLIAPGDDEV